MKNIYHIYNSSNSYSDNSWTEKDYYTCDNEQEYNEKIAEYKKQVEDYQKSSNAKIYGEWRFQISKEQEIHASPYYYAHEWQGKSFDAIGVCFQKHLERSNHYIYILKPNSVKNEKQCIDNSCAWMYGS